MGHAISGSDEPALLQRIRLGEDEAFGTLFEIHVSAVRRLARGIASDSSEAEDITAETFFRVLQALRRGNGPRDNVRAYLLTVARRVAWEWHGARRDVPVTDEELTSRAGSGADPQNRTAEATLITRAFSSLPERWRSVLWQTEVEGEQPAVVAPHFGLSPNATAALARRARIGLRAAYLQAHLAADGGRSAEGCRPVLEKLGGFTAGSVTGAEARKVEAHLGTCSSCRQTHDELREVCSSLRAHAGAVVLLVPASGLALAAGAAGLGTTGTAGGTAGAAGVGGGAAVGGGIGGTMAAMGANLKIGLALASTAAAGAVGMAAGPLADDHGEVIGLPGDGAVELRIADPSPGADRSDSARVSIVEPAAYEASVRAGQSRLHPAPAGQGPSEYQIPPGVEIAGEATKARGPRAGGTELPAEPGNAAGDRGSAGNAEPGRPRGDPGAQAGTPARSPGSSSVAAAKSTTPPPSSGSQPGSGREPGTSQSPPPGSSAGRSPSGSSTEPFDSRYGEPGYGQPRYGEQRYGEPRYARSRDREQEADSAAPDTRDDWCRWPAWQRGGQDHADGCGD
ncbi:RNA polymerase sigma factor, sigma-70 family [Saccharomonospora marina XMU15]|uniref:RNA polymerase sigma factor, sigma-70 family n=1 Tax=Saccharomonospora marina XMU15 TaxID=882083 RepID=H5X0C5_9PSEU|nr:sigma-70 family RNA polymerase sigma factor [Saccharomonospora marina]EHR48585.1 RNA polymerase sigma factor, sigma-70 family [Saccharomonospora marina XMU15]